MGALSPKRAWLAALLGVLATGLGHVYLRRWRRAVGWLAFVFVVTELFVDPAVMDSLATGGEVDLEEVAPALLIAGLSVLDAYVLARAHNAVARRRAEPTGRSTDCPHCGKALDPTLAFCHWCTTELDERPATDREEVTQQDGG